MAVVNNDKTDAFDPQTETRMIRVRTTAAAIVRDWETATNADKALISDIVDELVVFVT